MTGQSKSLSSETNALNCGTFLLPESSLVSEATLRALRQYAEEKNLEANDSLPPSAEEQRQQFYQCASYQRLRNRYAVEIKGKAIAGISVETITPSEEVSDANACRLLVNLHGGGFQEGSRK